MSCNNRRGLGFFQSYQAFWIIVVIAIVVIWVHYACGCGEGENGCNTCNNVADDCGCNTCGCNTCGC